MTTTPNRPLIPVNVMAKITLEAARAILALISRIECRQTFSSLWHLAQVMYEALGRLDHPDHPTDRDGGGMTREEYALRSTAAWVDPHDVGPYFVMPSTAITTGDQSSAAKGEWIYNKDGTEGHV